MRPFFAVPCVLACLALLPADDAVADFNKAMAGDDFSAKRDAIQAVAALPKEQDEVALELLVQAIGDRQGAETAVAAMRSRTGLTPLVGSLQTGTGYPGYPPTDDAAGWGAWISAWKKEHQEKKKLAEVEKKAKELEKKTKELEKKDKDKDKKEGPEGEGKTDGAEAGPKVKEKPPIEEGDKGPRCRIHFKNGGSKVYYLLSKRTDADGNLLSVRVSYLDGGGTEVLTADAIARLDEDIK